MAGILLIVWALLLPPTSWAAAQEFPAQARVSVAVADLRKEPVPPRETLDHDPLEESQLLYGDRVRVLEIRGDWAQVEALEQAQWRRHQRWAGYPGWILRKQIIREPPGWAPNLLVSSKTGRLRSGPEMDAETVMLLSLGTQLVGQPEQGAWKIRLLDGSRGWLRLEEATSVEELVRLRDHTSLLRARLVETARLLLGDPYYWGGRSAHHPEAAGPPHTAVDCSGLVGLAYQANALSIPRDAHEQWMRARAIPPEEVRPGDLIFFFDPEEEKRAVHVLMFAGGGRVIEAPGTDRRVREANLLTRLNDAKAAGRQVSYGSYLQ